VETSWDGDANEEEKSVMEVGLAIVFGSGVDIEDSILTREEHSDTYMERIHRFWGDFGKRANGQESSGPRDILRTPPRRRFQIHEYAADPH